jgi:predicted amidohydrolase
VARIVKIVSSSLGTLEQVSPPYNLLIPRLEDNVKRASDILDAAARYEPDLVLLPETFALAGMPASEIPKVVEDGEGPIIQMLRKKAKDGRMNLVAGYLMREDNRFYNRALVLDREGELVGS